MGKDAKTFSLTGMTMAAAVSVKGGAAVGKLSGAMPKIGGMMGAGYVLQATKKMNKSIK